MTPKNCSLGLFSETDILLLFVCLFFPAYGFSQEPFYKGKTVTMVRAGPSGDTGDMRVRALIPILQKYIPGNPTIVPEFMPGGGGRKAVNYIYKVARPDGLTIGNVGSGFASSAVLGEPGVQYDIDKLIYLGSGNSRTSYVFLSRSEAGLDTLEKLRTASGVRIGAQSVGHTIYNAGRLFAWLIDLKDPRFVTGYAGQEIDLALMSGEVDARANITDSVVERTPDWIEKGRVHFHALLEIPKGFRLRHPSFDRLPALDTFAKTELQRKVLAMFRNFRLIGSPYILPPSTPKERVEILEEAMRKSFKDPEFTASMRKFTGADASPLMPEEQAMAIKEIPRDPLVIDLYKKLAGSGSLPPR